MDTVFVALMVSAIILGGCASQTTTKYQCQNGQVVDNINLCAQQKCAELNCNDCAPKIEYQDRIVEKPVVKYYCADGKEVTVKEDCVDYLNPSWDLSTHKEDLINSLNAIQDPRGWNMAVEVTKLTVSGDTIDIAYTQKNAEFQARNVGQTMFTVMKETADYLKANKKLDYSIKISATASNGGAVFSKTTSRTDILKVLNYEIGMDDWISGIRTS